MWTQLPPPLHHEGDSGFHLVVLGLFHQHRTSAHLERPFFRCPAICGGEKNHQKGHAPENYQVISLNVGKFCQKRNRIWTNHQSSRGYSLGWKRGHFLVNHKGRVTYTTNLQGAKVLREYGLITTVDCEDELGDLQIHFQILYENRNSGL